MFHTIISKSSLKRMHSSQPVEHCGPHPRDDNDCRPLWNEAPDLSKARPGCEHLFLVSLDDTYLVFPRGVVKWHQDVDGGGQKAFGKGGRSDGEL